MYIYVIFFSFLFCPFCRSPFHLACTLLHHGRELSQLKLEFKTRLNCQCGTQERQKPRLSNFYFFFPSAAPVRICFFFVLFFLLSFLSYYLKKKRDGFFCTVSSAQDFISENVVWPPWQESWPTDAINF